MKTQLPGLYIVPTEAKGRSVFCVRDILEGSIIEICPVIILNAADTEAIHKTGLHDYYFVWDIEQNTSAIALGYGSLYNHSENPNADFDILPETEEISFFALRDIPAGEEITIDYIASKDEGIKLWFEVK